MANVPITSLPDAELPLTGEELIEISQLSSTVDITAVTISALASDNSYNDSANGFVAAGFVVGQRVNVKGFTGNVANNIKVGVITALTAGKMTIGGADGNVIVDDAAGESVTIAKWESRAVEMSEVGGGGGSANNGHAPKVALSIVSGVVDIDHSLTSFFELSLTANVTAINHLNLTAGEANYWTLRVSQDGTGGRTMAIPASWKYPTGGAAYVVSSGANDIDLVEGVSYNDGTSWLVSYEKDYA